MIIAFIGLGNMGIPMAKNIVKAGFALHAYNRSPEKMKDIVLAGGKAFTSLEEAVEDADVVITMLSDDAAVTEVTGKIIPVMKKGSIHLSMSTIGAVTSSALAKTMEEHQLYYIGAPVMGRPPAAEAKQLFVLLSGKAEAKVKVQSVLEAMSQRIFDYGDDPASAHTVKLMMNYMIFVVTEMLSEVMLMAEKSGIDKQMLLDTMTSTIFGSPVVKIYGGLVIQEKDNPNGFKTTLASKDLHLAQEAASQNNVTLPLGEVIQKHFKEIIAQQGGDKDVTLLVSFLREKFL